MIEQNIPLTEPKSGKKPKSELRLALEAMKPGDSFEIPKNISAPRVRATAYQGKVGKIAIRGNRVWKLA